MSLPWAVAGSSIANIISGFLQSNAAEKASERQVAATRAAANELAANYRQTRADLAPYRGLGQESLNQLLSVIKGLEPRINELTREYPVWDPSKVEDTAGYKFVRDQGVKGVEQAGLARGAGGNVLRGAAEFSKNLADTTYAQRFSEYLQGLQANMNQRNQLFSMLTGGVGVGQNAAAATGQLGQANAQGIANTLVQGGNAEAAGISGSANAWANSLNSVGQNLMLMQYLQNLPQNAPPKVPEPGPLAPRYYTVGNELTGRFGQASGWQGDGVDYYRSAA